MSDARTCLSSLSLRLVLIVLALAALAGNSLWAASVQSLAVTPQWSRVIVGGQQTVQAKAKFSNGTTGNVTDLASWSSSNQAIATVSRGGVVGVHPGMATLTASYQGHSAKILVTVAALRAVIVTPLSVRLSTGQSYGAKAVAIFTDGEMRNVTASASWTSANAGVAGVASGTIAGVSTGQTVVTASWDGHSGRTSVSVFPVELQRIVISPQNASIPKGVAQQFKATGTYSNATTKDLTHSVTWTSSQTNVASIASNGMAIGTGKGNTTIRATSGSISASATLTVTAAVLKSVQITPKSAAVAIGATQAFSATGVFTDNTTQPLTSGVVWTSSDAKVASVNAATGGATGEAPGTATITATANHISGTASLTVNVAQLQSIAVTPANGSAARGLTQQFKAVGTYTDGGTKEITALVSWSTSNIAAATINAQGLASTPGTGTATVTAADPSSSIQGSTTFTVTAAQVASLAITPATATVPLGDTQQYTATATLTDGTTQNVTTSVNWSTSTTTVPIARVSTSGLATTYAVGQSGVGATMPYGAGHANAVLNVTAAQLATIAVAPTNASVAAGLTQQLTAQGTYTDGNTHDLAQQVTWSSQNPAIATVDATTGVVTGIAPGAAALIATSNSNQSIQGTVQFQVTAAELTGITVSPSAGTAAAGTTLPFTAQGTYTDGTTPDITNQVTWSTSDSTLATISNTAGTNGLATALKAGGPVIVTATLGSVSSTTQLTITRPALISIAVTPAAMSVPAGIPQRYGATASFSDSSTQDITSSVTWSSSNPVVATISNNDDATRGLATTGAQGTTTISAAMNGMSGSTTLSVTQPSITSIVLNNSVDNSMVFTQHAANPYPLFVAGFFSDGSTQNVTSLAGWTVSNPAVATTNGSDLFDGTLSGQSTITAVVTDAYGNVLQASLQVTNAFAPAAPTAVSAVNNDGSGVVTVTWTPPADAIDSYQVSFVEANSNNTGQVDQTVSVPGTQTTATNSNGRMAYGLQYYVVVTARNPWGSTPSSPSATFTYVYRSGGCGGAAPLSGPLVRKAGGINVTPDCTF